MEHQVLTRKQVATIFGVHPLTIRKWERKNLLQPAYYQNGKPRYSLDTVAKVVTPKQETYYHKKVEKKSIT